MKRRELLLLLGSAIASSRTACAQQKAVPVIGYLNATAPDANAALLAAFRQGLSETGYVEGQNLAIEYRWAEFHYDRLPALAADLVGRKVDVIAACGGAGEALAAKNATSTIPIVITTGADPVESGLVASLARPGGNLTGVTNLNVELWQKRVELIAELVPQARVIGLLQNPNNAWRRGQRRLCATSGARERLAARDSEGRYGSRDRRGFRDCRATKYRRAHCGGSALRQLKQASCGAGGTPPCSDDLYLAQIRLGWRAD